MKKILFLIATILVTIPSCFAFTLKVTALNPKPNLALKNSKEKIYFLIDKNVEDNYVVPKQSGITKTNVSEWHTSLINGFKNGFSDFFTIVNDLSEADFILKISKADFEWTPAATRTNVSGSSGYVSSTTSVSSIRAQVTFKAQLVNKNGDIVKQCANTVIAKKVASGFKDVNPTVASALESMYEYIGNDFFEK
jgi:hypothetical protein